MDSCLLCIKSPNAEVESIKVNSIEWKELEIQKIIEKHFWDLVSSWLCYKCWAQLQDFHKFYISIEDAHIQLGTFITIESQEPELKDEVLIDETMLPNLFSERPEYIMKEELPKFEWDDGTPLIRKSKRLRQATKKVEDMKETSKLIRKKASNKLAKTLQENPTLEIVKTQPQIKHNDSMEINNDDDSNTDDNDDDDSNTDFNYELINNISFSRNRPPNQALDKFISENFKLKCVLCDIPMETYHALCDHFESEHQQRGYAVCCDKKFIRRYLLYEHLIQHLNPNYLKCFYCGKTFTNRQILKAHTKKQHTNPENNSANTTKEKFTKKETCKKTEIKHKHVTQEVNGESNDDSNIGNDHDGSDSDTGFNTESNFNITFSNNRPANKVMDTFIAENYKLTCALCDIPMETYRSLCDHFESEHNLRGYAMCCNKKFIRRYLLYEHLRQHLDPNYLKCYYCDKVFASRQILKAHSKKHHTIQGNPTADDNVSTEDGDSNSDFNNKSKNNRTPSRNRPPHHEMDVFITENFNLTCVICDIPMETFQTLSNHFESEHEEPAYAMCCDKKLLRRYLLFEHINQHLDPNYLKCNYCARSFTSRQILKAHLKTHDINREKNHCCEVCGLCFSTPHVLSTHKTRHLSEEEKLFPCSKCGKKFGTNWTLKSHIRSIHGQSFSCDFCGLICVNKSVLKKHINLKHSVGEQEVYTCAICSKTSINRQAQNRHVKYFHHMDYKHKCTRCDMAFKLPLSLRQHMATHTGIPLYSCTWCPKKFNKSSNLSSHRRKWHPKEWEEVLRKKYSGNLPPNYERTSTNIDDEEHL